MRRVVGAEDASTSGAPSASAAASGTTMRREWASVLRGVAEDVLRVAGRLGDERHADVLAQDVHGVRHGPRRYRYALALASSVARTTSGISPLVAATSVDATKSTEM